MRSSGGGRALATLVMLLLVTLPPAFGLDDPASDCDDLEACEAVPGDGGPFPPLLVTGHTVYAAWTGDLGVVRAPAFATVDAGDLRGTGPGAVVALDVERRLIQAECVVWLDASELDWVRWLGVPNRYPSDSDDLPNMANGTHADHDPDAKGATCEDDGERDPTLPSDAFVGNPTDFAVIAGRFTSSTGTVATFAAATEAGDCAPGSGTDIRFRGHLDLIDPNGVYHEVIEYDHICDGTIAALDATGGPSDDEVAEPAEDRLRERFWLTRTHDRTYDMAIGQFYTFALAIDTCAGQNVHERPVHAPEELGPALDTARATQQTVLDHIGPPTRILDRCTDGSSWSFDDTPRRAWDHLEVPLTLNELMRGNPFNLDPFTTLYGLHRESCRSSDLVWPYDHDYPRFIDCYAEDHLGAAIDLHMFAEDPTGGMWDRYTNCLATGHWCQD